MSDTKSADKPGQLKETERITQGPGPGRGYIPRGNHDLDVGGEQASPRGRLLRLVQGAAQDGDRNVGAALRQPQQRYARFGLMARLAGLAVALLGLGELATQSMQLA